MNTTSHERFFLFQRCSMGTSLLLWLSKPGTGLLKRHVCQDKQEPLIDKVELREANPQYAFMHYPDRRQDMVSLRDHTLMEGGGKSETSQELRMPTLDTLTDDYLQSPSPSGMNQAQTSN